MPSTEHLRKQARNLQKLAPELSLAPLADLPLTRAQEIVARINGYPNWSAAVSSARPAKAEPSHWDYRPDHAILRCYEVQPGHPPSSDSLNVAPLLHRLIVSAHRSFHRELSRAHGPRRARPLLAAPPERLHALLGDACAALETVPQLLTAWTYMASASYCLGHHRQGLHALQPVAVALLSILKNKHIPYDRTRRPMNAGPNEWAVDLFHTWYLLHLALGDRTEASYIAKRLRALCPDATEFFVAVPEALSSGWHAEHGSPVLRRW